MGALFLVFAAIFLVQWFVAYGLFFAHAQGEFPRIAQEDYRQDMGAAIAVGLLYGVLPILGPVLVFCLTGFAVHGFKWR